MKSYEVYNEEKWLGTICEEHHLGRMFAIAPFHAYPETWTPPDVRVENYLSGAYRSEYLPILQSACNNQPVWINELGYATTPGRSEAAQADWWVRAFGTFLADSAVSHLGIYALKDLAPDQPVIGDAPNYHLGLMHVDRKPKLAYRTVQMLVRLMGPEKRIRVDRSRIVQRRLSRVARIHFRSTGWRSCAGHDSLESCHSSRYPAHRGVEEVTKGPGLSPSVLAKQFRAARSLSGAPCS